MTGNNKVWRAPVAGLASVAMLATLGVTAMTANAAIVKDEDATVTYGNSGNTATAQKGFSALDADGVVYPKYMGSSTGKDFAGWTVDGELYDFNAPLTEDVKLMPSFITDGAAVVFEANGTSYPGYFVEPGSTVSPLLAPNDVADGKVLTGWKAVVDTESAQPVTIDDFKLGETKVPTGATKITLTAQYKDGKTLDFVFGGEYIAGKVEGLLGAKSDGSADAGSNPMTYSIDVLEDSTTDPASIESRIVYLEQDDVYGVKDWGYGSPRKVYTSNTKAKDVTEAVTADIQQAKKVTFKDGDTVLSETSVVKGNKVAKPADPTREDGSVFAGWKKLNETAWFNFDSAIEDDTTLVAQWVQGGSHTITFKYEDGVTEDETVTYIAGQKTVEPADPAREGYVFAGWYADNGNGVFDALDSEYTTWGQALTANIVLFAKWIQAGEDVSDLAFEYIDAANDASKNVFSASSYAEYKQTYLDLQKRYVADKVAAEGKGEKLTAEQASDYINELQTAWNKLVFKHNGTTADRNVVYRLNKGDKHLYSSDPQEIRVLTSTESTMGGWTNEGAIFSVANSQGGENGLEYFSAFTGTYAPLADFATPLLHQVNRLYSPTTGEHLYTIDQEEYEYNAGHGWDGEGAAFYVPTNGGRTTVYRLAKDGKHLYSVDAHEVEVLSAQQGWTVEGIAFKAY